MSKRIDEMDFQRFSYDMKNLMMPVTMLTFILAFATWVLDWSLSKPQPDQWASVVSREYNPTHQKVEPADKATGLAKLDPDLRFEHEHEKPTPAPDALIVKFRTQTGVISSEVPESTWAACEKPGTIVWASWRRGFITGRNYGWEISL